MQKAYYVFNKTRESFLGLGVSCADSPSGRLRALLGKLRITQGGGLWLVPSRGIHTIGMRFPIDVIYLNADHQVIHMVEHLRPFRFSPNYRDSSSLLGLPAHTIYASQTKLADRLLICPPEEMETYLASANRSTASTEAKG
jgi:uncharacterized membrane protein (UPF0127 family)